MDAKKVGQNIAYFRKEKGMTQKELADNLNVVDKTISRWECGYGLPDVSILPKIAAIFDVSIEAIIGADSDSMQPESQGSSIQAKTVKRRKISFIAIAGALIFIAVIITLSLLLIDRANHTINNHAWAQCLTSDANFVFITAFGAEECMSLELNGDLKNGKFSCVETWSESKGGKWLDCRVTGRYTVGETGQPENVISFYVDELIDPSDTNKLRTQKALGIDAFRATLESQIFSSASLATFDKNDIEAIVFNANTKNTEESVFGRWTKFSNYFSREVSEVYFSRVRDKMLINRQYSMLPRDVLHELGVTAPETLSIGGMPSKTSYYVGEKADFSGLTVNLEFSDGHKEDVTGKCTVDIDGKILTPADKTFTVTYSDGGVTKKTSGIISVSHENSWAIAKKSNADYVLFTYYKTGKSGVIDAFTCIELNGNINGGRFTVSETYGKETFGSFITAIGSYTVAGAQIRFKCEGVYASKESSRFAVSENGNYYTANLASIAANSRDADTFDGTTLYAMSFMTTETNRNFFGYYTNGDALGNTFSRETGEVYLERVQGNTFSAKAAAFLAGKGIE